MIKQILNWVAYKSDYATRCRSALQKAERAARKLEQGYRENYVRPRFELDELIRNKENIKELINEGRYYD